MSGNGRKTPSHGVRILLKPSFSHLRWPFLGWHVWGCETVFRRHRKRAWPGCWIMTRAGEVELFGIKCYSNIIEPNDNSWGPVAPIIGARLMKQPRWHETGKTDPWALYLTAMNRDVEMSKCQISYWVILCITLWYFVHTSPVITTLLRASALGFFRKLPTGCA